MPDFDIHSPFTNPWLHHFQKLGIELKCPFCLNLYDKPVLLPCNHIFCSSCVPKSILLGSECPLCKLPYNKQELRQAPYMENMVNIYKCLDASVSKHMLISEQYPVSAKTNLSGQRECKTRLMVHHQTITAQQEHEAVNLDMNLMELSPDSPPSSGASKGVEIDGQDPGNSYDASKMFPLKKPAKRKADDFEALGMNEFSASYLKKQKQLHAGPEMLETHSPPSMSMNLQNSVSTGTDLNPKSGTSAEFDSTSLLNFTCAFCQTWKITEASGLMLHFADAKQVFGSVAGGSNVIHVHKNCIEWAPQIFFENTLIKNLGKELARAAKLKCTGCGLKGAALGCYVKSCRRSYHAPCAFGIKKCRWDSDEFLMLCPSHTSHKFPSEMFRKPASKKFRTSAQFNDEQKTRKHESDFWASSSTGAKKWILCGSALSADEKFMLVKFAKLCGATVTSAWNPNVTHVIAAADANGACTRTFKVLMAILKGSWILKTDWIDACMRSKSPVDEEPYEISLDNHECYDGPKTGRLRVLINAPKLLTGMKFLFTGDFLPTYKSDIQNLIVAAGGSVLESMGQLQRSRGSQPDPSTTLVVYNSDGVMGTEDSDAVSRRQVEAEGVAVESGSKAIPHTWILDSIAASALQPFTQR